MTHSWSLTKGGGVGRSFLGWLFIKDDALDELLLAVVLAPLLGLDVLGELELLLRLLDHDGLCQLQLLLPLHQQLLHT